MILPVFNCTVKFYEATEMLPPQAHPSNYSNEVLLLNKDRETIGLGYFRFDELKFYNYAGFELADVVYWGEIPSPVPLPQVYIVVFAEDGSPAEFVHPGTQKQGVPKPYNTHQSAYLSALALDGKFHNPVGTREVKSMTNGEYNALVESRKL